MSGGPDLFEQLIQRIDRSIEKNPVSVDEAIQTKQMTPMKFLEKFCPKELILLHRFSSTRIKGALSLMLSVCETILKKKPSNQNWQFPQVNRLCIYYNLAASCCNSRPITPTEEVADEAIGRVIISQCDLIFGQQYGTFTNYVQRNFSTLLAAVGSHSSNIFTYFLNNLQSQIIANIPIKALPTTLQPWVYMPASVDRISNFLKPIASNISLVTEKYRQPFCEMITSSILMAFSRDPVAFRAFLSRESDIMIAGSILDQLNEWNDKINPYAWPCQLLLYILQPSKLRNISDLGSHSLFAQIKSFATVKATLQLQCVQTLLTLFRAFVLSNGHPILRKLAEPYFPTFSEYILSDHISLANSFTATFVTIDFPIACLMIDSKAFEPRIQALFNESQKDETPLILSKVIRRVCKAASLITSMPSSLITSLNSECHSLLGRILSDSKQLPALLCVIRAFQYYPKLMRMLMISNPENLKTFLEIIKKYEEISPQFALYGFWDPKFVNEQSLDPPFIQTISTFLSFLIQTYEKVTMIRTTSYGDTAPHVIVLISEFVLAILQSNPIEETDISNSLGPIFRQLETASLILLASSRKQYILDGVTILSALLEMVHSSPAFDSFDLPRDQYQILVTEAHRAAVLNTAHPSIKNALRLIEEPTEGINNAFNILMPYFFSMTKMLSPNMSLNYKADITIDHPLSLVNDEWIGTISILFSLMFDQSLLLLSQLRTFLNDSGDIGAYSVTAVPSSIAKRNLLALTNLMLTWLSHMQGANGFFEITPANNVFVQNVMNLMRGLAEQHFWTPEMIKVSIFGQISEKLVSYCNLVAGENFKLMCTQMLISMVTLTNGKGMFFDPKVRHQIGKSLLTWLPTIGNSTKQYISAIHKALALVLDDLSLHDCIDSNDPHTPDEQAESQFMFYFASIKNRLDTQETSATDMIPVLAALLKQNLGVGIGHCVSMGFADKNVVRAAFIAAVAAVFKVPETKAVTAEEINDEINLIDILFKDGMELIDFVAALIPYSRADTFGAAAMEAAILKNRENEFLEAMLSTEVRTIDEASKNTILRGNAVPARAVGQYPRLVASDWMVSTLRPVYDEVIANCDKGMDYVVDPKKLPQGEDIEANRTNFRNLLTGAATRILNARNTMPPGLVRESQLIYKKVYEKYGDFAIQILGGFLFLRFLLPALTLPKTVGLPPVLPDKPRAAMVQLATILMAALNNKGKLEEKGDHYAMFDDAGEKIYNDFVAMYMSMINCDVGNQRDNVKVDEKAVLQTLHEEIYPILPTITTAVKSLEESNPLKRNVETLVQKVMALGQPANVHKARTTANKESSALDEIMNLTFPDEQMKQCGPMFLTEDHNAPDGNTIIYFFCSKLSYVKDPRIVPHLLFKALSNIKFAHLVMICEGFDEDKIPPPEELEKLSQIDIAAKIKEYIILEPSVAFTNFSTQNPKLFEKTTFAFPTELARFNDIVGSVNKLLPHTSSEYLGQPISVHKAVVNSSESNVRLHETSVQIVSSPVDICNQKVSPVEVYPIESLDSFTRPIPTRKDPNQSQFIINLTSGLPLTIKVNNDSTLFESVHQLTLRSRTMKSNVSRVSVDNSTIQWLMLNLAFINILSPHVISIVRKGAIDLIYAVFVSFQFKHSTSVSKMDARLLPGNLISYVCALSDDLAKSNPEAAPEFLTEFFKTLSYVEPSLRQFMFLYSAPWIKEWTEAKEPKDDVLNDLVEVYSESFSKYVWPYVSLNSSLLEKTLKMLFDNNPQKASEIVIELSSLKPKEVTKILIEILKKCVDDKDDKINIVCSFISSIITHGTFDFTSEGAELIYIISKMRIFFAKEKLTKFSYIVSNILHYILQLCNGTLNDDFNEINSCFCSTDIFAQFSGDGPKRPWLYAAARLASAFNRATLQLSDKNVRSALHNMFIADLTSDNLAVKSQALIYSAAFTVGNDMEYAAKLVAMLKDTDPTAICLSLAQLQMDGKLASKILFIGLVAAFEYRNPAAADAVVSSISFIAKEGQIDSYGLVAGGVAQALVQYLEQCTALNFSSSMLSSAIFSIIPVCDNTVKSQISALGSIESKCPMIPVIKAVVSGYKASTFKNITGAQDVSNVAASLLLILKKDPSLVGAREAFVGLAQMYPEATNSFPIVGPVYGTDIMQKVGDAGFLGVVIRNAKKPTMQLAPALLQYFVEMPPVKLTKEQADYLIGSVFSA